MEGLVVVNELTVEGAVPMVGGSIVDDSMEEFLSPKTIDDEDPCNARFSSFASRPFVWAANQKPQTAKYFSPDDVDDTNGIPLSFKEKDVNTSPERELAEIEMMRERLAKLLLGEDMSGSGNGVQTALAISNAITNLCASVFGQLWRLEPLPQIKKTMWRRELEYILAVTDYIVVLSPSWHISPDGSKVEIMSTQPRSDLAANLPALRKLDSMLLEILDCFTDTEFWYVEKGLASPDESDEVASLSSKTLKSQEEKWWLPVPQVPPGGLSENTQKMLQNKRDCAKQILKAVTAINNMTLADMEVPEFFCDDLPKNAKDCLGERVYLYLASNKFSAERLVTALGISSDHQALEIANQVEAAIFVFNKKANLKDTKKLNHSSKNSWELVKDFTIDAPKMELLAGRAETLLLCLKQRFPGLPQTTLDTIKIQYNRDIGKSILEGYSRVLESLAFNIIGRIDDVLYADDNARIADQELKLSKARTNSLEIVPVNNTSVASPDKDCKKVLAKKTTLISHIPSLQTSNCGDFEI